MLSARKTVGSICLWWTRGNYRFLRGPNKWPLRLLRRLRCLGRCRCCIICLDGPPLKHSLNVSFLNSAESHITVFSMTAVLKEENLSRRPSAKSTYLDN